MGQHRLALKAEYVNSVSRQEAKTPTLTSSGKRDLFAMNKINLAEKLRIDISSSDRLIKCNVNGKSMELLVEKILGLIESSDAELMAWPSLIKKITVFSGILMVNSDMYLLLDITKIGVGENG